MKVNKSGKGKTVRLCWKDWLYFFLSVSMAIVGMLSTVPIWTLGGVLLWTMGTFLLGVWVGVNAIQGKEGIR